MASLRLSAASACGAEEVVPDDESTLQSEDVPFDCQPEKRHQPKRQQFQQQQHEEPLLQADSSGSSSDEEVELSDYLEGEKRYNNPNPNSNSNSNAAVVDRPVKISVVKYKEAREAVNEAIQSVEHLTRRIATEREADLGKPIQKKEKSSCDGSVYTSEEEEEEEKKQEEEEEEEPEIVVRASWRPSRQSKEDFSSEEEEEEEEEVSLDSTSSEPVTNKDAPKSTSSGGGVLSYFYPSFISGNHHYSNHTRSRIMSSGKTRVAERLTAASNKPTDVNRSGELDNLKEKFETFIKQFKPLVTTLKNYHAAIIHLEYNRSEMLQLIEAWSKETPLYDAAGSGNVVVSAPPAWAKDYSKQDHSYCSMERQMSALNSKYAQQLLEYVIEYVQEWEIVVTTRIRSSIKQAEDLRKDLNHYDKKVKGLVDTEQKTTERGKTPTDAAKEKLKRNQEKLDMARQEFDKYATSVCHIIDSALQQAWMDMTPLVYRLANMEFDRLGGKNAEAFTKSLNDLVQKLKDLAHEFDIDMTLPDQVAKPAPPSATKAPPKTPTRTKSNDSSTKTPTSTEKPTRSKSNDSTEGGKKIEDPPKKAAPPKSPKRSLFGGGGGGGGNNKGGGDNTPEKK